MHPTLHLGLSVLAVKQRHEARRDISKEETVLLRQLSNRFHAFDLPATTRWGNPTGILPCRDREGFLESIHATEEHSASLEGSDLMLVIKEEEGTRDRGCWLMAMPDVVKNQASPDTPLLQIWAVHPENEFASSPLYVTTVDQPNGQLAAVADSAEYSDIQVIADFFLPIAA